MDKMWSFVSDKAHQCWLWWAIDHNTGVPLAYCFGTREHKHLDELRSLLAPFRIGIVYCDDNSAYKMRITESIVNVGKRNTQCIERKHLSLRTWCSRLVRKGIRFSKITHHAQNSHRFDHKLLVLQKRPTISLNLGHHPYLQALPVYLSSMS